jgi:hypothetical protein
MVYRSHPNGVASRKVIVYGDQVGAVALNRIEIQWKSGDERFALARFHFGDLALVEGDSAKYLDIEMPHVKRAAANFANRREGFGQNVFERRTGGQSLPELLGLGGYLLVAKLFVLRLEGVRLFDERHVALDFILAFIEPFSK